VLVYTIFAAVQAGSDLGTELLGNQKWHLLSISCIFV